MQGPIAQAVALTIAGNAALRGTDVSGFWRKSSVFRHNASVSFVKFAAGDSHPVEYGYAPDPLAWFRKLAGLQVKGLRLHHVPGADQKRDWQLVGLVGGGGRWLIEAVKPNGTSDVWEARWEMGGEGEAPGLWKTTYMLAAEYWQQLGDPSRPIAVLWKELEVALEDIASFAEREVDPSFAEWFRKGLPHLRSKAPLRDGFHHDIDATSELPIESQQLLGAVLAGWAFGGMGSWNDTGPRRREMQVDHERLSVRLYELMVECIVAAATSSYREAPQQPIGFRPRTAK